MAKRKIHRRTRKMAARIQLTKDAYRQVESAAFKNCRTVSQELTYMIESLIGKRIQTQIASDSVPVRYDDPAPMLTGAVGSSDDFKFSQQPSAPAESTAWTQEQEDQAFEVGRAKGLSEAQVTTLRLLHKTPEAVAAAIEAESVGKMEASPV